MQISPHRLKAAWLLHSQCLHHTPAALRLEGAAFDALWGESVASASSGPFSAPDQYLKAVTHLSFALARPELAELRRRVLLRDQALLLQDLVRAASEFGDLKGI